MGREGALQKAGDKDDLPLFARVSMPELEPDAHLPSMLPGEQVIEDYRHLHLSLKAHPVSFLRRDLDARGIVRHELLPTLRRAGASPSAVLCWCGSGRALATPSS